ncbi:hypothetical protein ACFQ0I_15890 [Mariniflexile aquimaris]|uniref:Outer membrane protein beta-barrel domain-containing protein n=1 Tax=Mariniflexile aquimaris TaxID=881009 RepID=A0ABW3BY81_9FLAO
MKLKIFIISLFFTTFSYSQITKNNWLVGGSGNFKTTTTKFLSDGTKPYDNRTIFTIAPNVGYFFYDKLSGGISLSYTYDNIFEDYQYFGIGPFVRYYFLNPEKRINLFLQGNYNYYEGGAKTVDGNDTGKFHNNGHGFKAGSAIFLNSSVALELSLDYISNRLNSTLKEKTFMIGAGFQIHLEK